MKYKASLGFSLIEVLVAMLISSMLLVSLYQAYRQIQRSIISINNVIDIDSPFMSMFNRLDFDIAGIIAPSTFKAELKALQEKNKKPDEKNNAQQEGKDQKKIENVFNYNASGKNFKLTFLTTGGIKSLDTSSSSDGQATATISLKPYIKRVVYTLEPDRENSDMYTLMWAQTDDINMSLPDAFALKKFELAWGIKEMSFTFGVYDIKDKDDGSQSSPKLITLNNFTPKEVFENYKTYIPAFITIKGVIADQRDVRQKDFLFEFSVPAYSLPEVDKTAEQNESAPDAKKEQPKAPVQNGNQKPQPKTPTPVQKKP